MGRLTQQTVSAAIGAATINALTTVPRVNVSADLASTRADLLAVSNDIAALLHGAYLGYGATREFPSREIKDALTTPAINISNWVRPGVVPVERPVADAHSHTP